LINLPWPSAYTPPDYSNSYQPLNDASSNVALPLLTGLPAQHYVALDQGSFNAAITRGDLVVLNSDDTSNPLYDKARGLISIDGWYIVPQHAYAVVGSYANAAGDQIYVLYNPWGDGGNPYAHVMLGLDWSEITAVFRSYDQGGVPGNIKAVGITACDSCLLNSIPNAWAFQGGSIQPAMSVQAIEPQVAIQQVVVAPPASLTVTDAQTFDPTSLAQTVAVSPTDADATDAQPADLTPTDTTDAIQQQAVDTTTTADPAIATSTDTTSLGATTGVSDQTVAPTPQVTDSPVAAPVAAVNLRPLQHPSRQ
jgi:hypothetical protein